MDSKILLNSTSTIFEPHIRANRELPFIYHMDQTCGRQVSNFHENLELLYFIQGCGTVENDGKKHPVERSSLIVVNSYAVHQVDSRYPLKYFCLIIDNSFCKYHDIDISSVYFEPLIRDERFEFLFQKLISECASQNPFKSTAIKLTVLDILLLLCRNYSKPQTAQAAEKEPAQVRIHAAIRFIKKNIQRKLTVAEVASTVGLSQYHFMREFKRITGCTLTNYINIIRCEYAKELLQTGQYKVKDVAFLCGFESESYFNNVFKKYTDSLPSQHIRAVPQIN